MKASTRAMTGVLEKQLIPAEMRQDLHAQSRAMGVPVAEAVRMALSDWLYPATEPGKEEDKS